MQPRLSAPETANQNGLLAILERAIRLSISPIICLTLTTALVFTACDSDDDNDDNSRVELASVALLNQAAAVGDYVVLVDADSNRVFSIDVSAKEAKLASKLEITEDIAPNPYWIEAREDSDSEVLILSSGRRGVSQQPTLTAMTVGDRVKLREYEINAPFDQLLQSSNGNYAVLYFSEESGDRVYNLNEIAVVDLEADDDDEKAVVRQTIDTATGGISHIDISPRITIGKIKRTVAIALSDSRVTVVDLDNEKRNHTIVSLGGGSNERPIMPEQVEFSASEQEIYVRARNSNDIFVLMLGQLATEKDFITQVSQVPVGLEPSDMEVYKDGDEATKLLVVSKGSNDVHIISRSATDEDLPEGVLPQTVRIALNSEVEQVALFKIAGSDDSDKNVALLYKQGSRTLTLLDLDNAETDKEQNRRTITLKKPVLSVVEFEKDGLALITHQSSQIDVIDIESGDVSTIQINGSFQNAVFDTNHPRFWMAPPNQHFVSYVDLDTGSPNDEAVLLDDPIMQFVVVYDADKVVAVHEHEVCEQETDEDEDGDDDGDDEEDEDEEDEDEEDEACDTEPISISILDYEEPSRDDLIQFSAFLGDQK